MSSVRKDLFDTGAGAGADADADADLDNKISHELVLGTDPNNLTPKNELSPERGMSGKIKRSQKFYPGYLGYDTFIKKVSEL